MPKGKYERKQGWKPHNYKEVAWSVEDNGCWICTSHRPNILSGYHEMNRNGKMIRVHRHMYEKYKGEIPNGLLICHKCDNPSCINPDHLFVGTPKENSEDMVMKGRSNPPRLTGEMIGTSKLKISQIIDIRKDNRLQREIAKDYGIAQCHVSRIKLHQTWVSVLV